MCFQIMHIVSKFQFFIHISIVVKLKNKIQNFRAVIFLQKKTEEFRSRKPKCWPNLILKNQNVEKIDFFPG